MTNEQVAYLVLKRRNTMNPIVMIGEMHNLLGADGFQFALENRWIVPDYATGDLQITENTGILEEIRALAENAAYKVGDSVLVTGDDGHPYSATIQGINPDGTYALAYGEKKPAGARPEQAYRPEQLRPVARPDVNLADPHRIRQNVPIPEKPESAPRAGGGAGPSGPGIG